MKFSTVRRFSTGNASGLLRDLLDKAVQYYMSGFHRLILVCIIVGLVTGAATHILDLLLHFISSSLTSGLSPAKGNAQLILFPVVGILLTVAYTRWIVKEPLNHGTLRIKEYLATRRYRLPLKLSWASIVGSSITLGFGGSAGAEGPSASTGSAIASNIGKLFNLSPEQMRTLIGIGAGAGIAGIFRSPIGGVLFTLEVLRMPLSTPFVIALIVASLAAGLTSYMLAGQHFDVTSFYSMKPDDANMGFILLLGIVCGIYSLYYTYVFNNTGHRIDRISNVWLKAILSGLMIGLAIFLFPPLYATGYDTLDKILAGDYQSILGYSLFGSNLSDPMLLVAMAAGIVMVKAFVCSATNYGGGVAGNFAPTLFAGGFLGYVFATLANDCLGATLHVPNFIFLGMAGVMSGVIQAPLMAIFLTAEMADRADFLWPLSVVALVSWGIRRLLGRSLPGV